MNSLQIPGRYDFSIPEAQRLSDLAGILADLEAVTRICARCERLMDGLGQPTEADGVAWLEELQSIGDLTFAAVVRYGRTLASGVRQGIPSDRLASLSADLQESHAYFKVLRDKYVAHSVSQLEDNQVFVFLSPQFAEQQEAAQITVDRGRLVTLGIADLRRLSCLAQGLNQAVAKEIESESSRLLEIARSMSIDSIRAHGAEAVPIPGNAHAFKVRKKF